MNIELQVESLNSGAGIQIMDLNLNLLDDVALDLNLVDVALINFLVHTMN